MINSVILLRMAVSGNAPVVKAHDGSSDRNTALFLYLHPVGSSRLANLITFNRAGYMNGTAVEQKFLGQRRLTGIRVRDNRKSAASEYFLLISGG